MIRAKLDKKLEQLFREAAMRKFGYGKGALSKAVEEAILTWLSTIEKEKVSFEGDPVEAIDGLLSDIKISSLELQHKIKDLWLTKIAENISN